MKYTQSFAIPWLTMVALITVGMGTIYVTVQQDIRQGANDPQIQIAHDVAYALNHASDGDSAATLLDQFNFVGTNIAQSQSPFVEIYNDQGTVLSSTGTFVQEGYSGNEKLTIPKGVLDVAKTQGENRVSWQPMSGYRYAAVVVPFTSTSSIGSGSVVVARSLVEAEKRENALTIQIIFSWMVATLLSLMLARSMQFNRADK